MDRQFGGSLYATNYYCSLSVKFTFKQQVQTTNKIVRAASVISAPEHKYDKTDLPG